MRRTRSSMLLLVVSCHLLGFVLSEGWKNNKEGVMTLPLLPHNVVLDRHRRELGLSLEGKDYPIGGGGRRRRRRRVLGEEIDSEKAIYDQQFSALYQGYGTHYLDLWIGSPVPQRQTVIVDTGSQMIAFPCDECRDCGEEYHTDKYFDRTASETFQTVDCDGCKLGRCSSKDDTCNMGLSYQEGSSWAAKEGSDTAFVGGAHFFDDDEGDKNNNPFDLPFTELPEAASNFAFNMHFGCEDHITGLFKTQLATGILGMSNDNASLWRQMHDAGVIPDKKFSLCFNRKPEAQKEGTNAGAITLGGSERKLHLTDMVFAKNLRNSGFYSVHVVAVYLLGPETKKNKDNGELRLLDVSESTLNAGGMIVDSGTTDTYLNKGIATEFMKEWKAITGFDFANDKLKLSDEQIDRLPTILIQITGHSSNADVVKRLGKDPKDIPGLAAAIDADRPLDVIVQIPPYHYIEYDDETQSYYCRVYVDERRGSVIGANTMQFHDVLFDMDNKRIGWAQSDCDYEVLTGQNKTVVEVDGLGRGFEPGAIDEQFCESSLCQFGAMAGLALAAVQAMIAWKMFRRRNSNMMQPVDTNEGVGTYTDDAEREIL